MVASFSSEKTKPEGLDEVFEIREGNILEMTFGKRFEKFSTIHGLDNCLSKINPDLVVAPVSVPAIRDSIQDPLPLPFIPGSTGDPVSLLAFPA